MSICALQDSIAIHLQKNISTNLRSHEQFFHMRFSFTFKSEFLLFMLKPEWYTKYKGEIATVVSMTS